MKMITRNQVIVLDFTRPQMLQTLAVPRSPCTGNLWKGLLFNALSLECQLFPPFFLLGGLKALPFSKLRVSETDLLTEKLAG